MSSRSQILFNITIIIIDAVPHIVSELVKEVRPVGLVFKYTLTSGMIDYLGIEGSLRYIHL